MLLLSIFLSTIAGGLFWTGFPVFFHQQDEASVSLASIYSIATFGSLIFSLAGGYLADTVNFKKMSVIGNGLSCFILSIICASIFWGRDYIQPLFVLFLLPPLYFIFALSQVSESVWVIKLTEGAPWRSRFFDRMILSFSGKLLGFSLGPVLFTQCPRYSLLFCMLLFAGTTGIQWKASSNEKKADDRTETVSLKKLSSQNMRDLMGNPSLLMVGIITGMLSVPYNVMIADHLLKEDNPSMLSFFWLAAGLAAIAGMLFLKKIQIKNIRQTARLCSIGLVVALLVSLFAKNPLIIIAAAALYILIGTFFSLHVRLLTLEKSSSQVLGSSAGVIDCLIDSGVFLGMLMGLNWGPSSIMMLSVPVVLLFARYFSFLRLVETPNH